MTTTKHDFLSLLDLSKETARDVLARAETLKREPKGRRTDLLRGRSIAILLEKASTRTRVSFETGIAQLGAHPVVLGVQGSQLGRGEPIKDTARVLARYCDAIVFRTSTTARLREMATYAGCPVVNALSDDGHPVQVLCDDSLNSSRHRLAQIDERDLSSNGKSPNLVQDCGRCVT